MRRLELTWFGNDAPFGSVELRDGVAVVDEGARRFLTEYAVPGNLTPDDGELYMEALAAALGRGGSPLVRVVE
jgi:hypothetical protein